MGLMLSILVVCVGVIEALSCFEHFQYGVIHCATNVYENARRRSSVFLQYTSRRLKLLSENSISECDEPPNTFEPIKFGQDSFERQAGLIEEGSDDFVSIKKPKAIRISAEPVKKLEKEDKIQIVKTLLEKPRRPKTVRSISMPELVHTEEDIELTKIINDLVIEPIEEVNIEIEDATCEIFSREFDQLFNDGENSPQDSGFKGSPMDEFDEDLSDSETIEETKCEQLESDVDIESIIEENAIQNVQQNLNEMPAREEDSEFLKMILEKEKPITRVIKTNISQRVNEKGADLFKEALSKRGSIQKSRSSGLDRSISVDFSKVSSMMINKPAAVEAFSEMSNDSLELIPDEYISRNKLEDIILESDTPPEEVIDKTFDEIYENICDESLDVANTFEEIEKNILGNEEAQDLHNLALYLPEENLLDFSPDGETSLSTGKTVSNAVFLKAVEQLAELLVRDSLNLHKIRNMIIENLNNLSNNDGKFNVQSQLGNRIVKENVCQLQEVPDVKNVIKREEKSVSRDTANDGCLREEKTKTVSVEQDDLGDAVEEEFEKIVSSILGSEVSKSSVGADVELPCSLTNVKRGEVLAEFPANLKTEVRENVREVIVKFLPDSDSTKTDVDNRTEHEDNLYTQEGIGGQNKTKAVLDDNSLLPKGHEVEIVRLQNEPIPSVGENDNAKPESEIPTAESKLEDTKTVLESGIESPRENDHIVETQERLEKKSQNNTAAVVDERNNFLPSKEEAVDLVKNIQGQKPHLVEVGKECSQILERLEYEQSIIEFPKESGDAKIKVEEHFGGEISKDVAKSDGPKSVVSDKTGPPLENVQKGQTQEKVEIDQNSTASDRDKPNKEETVDVVKNLQLPTAELAKECTQVLELLEKEPTSSTEQTIVEHYKEGDDAKSEIGKNIIKVVVYGSESIKTTIESEAVEPLGNDQKIQTLEKIEIFSQNNTTADNTVVDTQNKDSFLPSKEETVEVMQNLQSQKTHPEGTPSTVQLPAGIDDSKTPVGNDIRRELPTAAPEPECTKTSVESKIESLPGSDQIVQAQKKIEMNVPGNKAVAINTEVKVVDDKIGFLANKEVVTDSGNTLQEEKPVTVKLEKPKEDIKSEIGTEIDETVAVETIQSPHNQTLEHKNEVNTKEKESKDQDKDQQIEIQLEEIIKPQQAGEPLLKFHDKVVEPEPNAVGIVETSDTVKFLSDSSNKSGGGKPEVESKIKGDQNGQTEVKDKNSQAVISNKTEEKSSLLPKKEEAADFIEGLQEGQPLPGNIDKPKKNEKSSTAVDATTCHGDSDICEKIETVESKHESLILEDTTGFRAEEKKKIKEKKPANKVEQEKLEESVLKFHDKIGESEDNVHFEQVVEGNAETLQPDSKNKTAANVGLSSPEKKNEHSSDSKNSNERVTSEATSSAPEAFWLIFSGEYTKAMSKDWHSGHFSCWQCDEALTGQRYVLRDDHPYCIKCYESVFANVCEECNKIIGIDSKDLSYKDKHWHEACFLCNKCRVSLVDKQFGSKADKIYCGNCYDAQFASRCDGCGEIFRAGTKKMEYKTRQWHEKCFCCCVCKTPIGTKSFIPREQEIYCATCYEEKFATRCVKCNKIITSGGVTYKNEPWHRECFTCTNCNTSLAGQRFTSRDEKPYCADCFGELFAKRCTACSRPITGIGGTRFISFEDRHWHNDCFICASCKTSLVGRGFITDGDDIICPECAKQKLM